jgi:hypothetical protein
MAYLVLSQDEQDDIIVQFLGAQERDQFCHALNQTRYEAMGPALPDGDFKTRVQNLLETTIKAKAEVESIIAETTKQLPDQARIDAAIARVKGK